jgi:hypothetical protein
MTELNSIVSLLRTRQGEHEDATTYFQQLELPLETAKDVCGGPFVPMGMMTIKETVETVDNAEQRHHEIVVADAELERFNVCIFLLGLDPGRHKEWISELESDYVANNDNYPKTLREALAQTIDREDKLRKIRIKQKAHKNNQTSGERVESSFAQLNNQDKHPKSILKKKNKQPVTRYQVCQFCGDSGHASADCPKYVDSDSEFFQDDCDDDQSEPEYGYQCVGLGG